MSSKEPIKRDAHTREGLLRRLYRAKLVLASLIGLIVGIAILVVGVRVNSWTSESSAWLRRIPWEAIGSTIASASLILTAFEYIGRSELEERSLERLNETLPKQTVLIRQALVEGLAFEPQAFAESLSNETLDMAISNCLALRLGDKQLSSDLYEDLKSQVIRAPERWADLRVGIDLSTYSAGSTRQVEMMVATVRCEYTTIIQRQELEFICVDDIAAYRTLLAASEPPFTWYVEPTGDLRLPDPRVFSVEQVTVNGKQVPIVRHSEKGREVFTAPLEGTTLGLSARIVYTYRYLQQRKGHAMYFDIAQPSKGVAFHLDYTDCGISWVNVFDFLPSIEGSRVERSPDTVPTRSISVAFDGWVFPKSGIVFVWVLDEESAP